MLISDKLSETVLAVSSSKVNTQEIARRLSVHQKAYGRLILGIWNLAVVEKLN